MSTAEQIVSALIEDELSPEEFMQSFGMRRLLGFHFAPASRYYHTRGDSYPPGSVLVYANRPDDTRDFVGVIREIKDVGWIPVAVNRPGAPSHRVPLHAGKPWPTKEEAADEVLRAFEANLVPESEMSPKEFVKSMPHLLSRFEFIPALDGALDVKRWENGSYYYIGSVAEIYSSGRTWVPYALAPVGRRHHATLLGISGDGARSTREEAARDLWGIYKAEMDSVKHK